MWDKLFWLWFALLAVLFLVLFLEEAGTLTLVFGSLLVGLALIKLAVERSARSPRVSRRLLRKLSR